MTNNERIDKIHELLAGYQYSSGFPPGGMNKAEAAEDAATSISDALCDVMHWCDAHEIAFKDLLETADMHYQAEKDCAQCKAENEGGVTLDEDDEIETDHDCEIA